MMNLIGVLITILVLVLDSGCGKAPSSATATTLAAAPVTLPSPTPSASPSPAPSPTPIALTYYSKPKTVAPIGGWPTKTYTATGSCVVYLSSTYCWDDGLKSLSWTDIMSGTSYGPYVNTYWGMNKNGASYTSCSNSCTQDLMSGPTFISTGLAANIPAASITAVLTTGTAKAVTCTLSGNSLDCVDFIIDLAQPIL